MHQNIRQHIVFLIAFTLVLFGMMSQPVNAQEHVDRHIQWVRQYPAAYRDVQRTLLERVGRALFGSKPDLVLKPISATGDDQGNLWILSQGNGLVVKSPGDGKGPDHGYNHQNAGYPSLVDICYAVGTGVIFTDSYLQKVFVLAEGSSMPTDFAPGFTFTQPTGVAYSSAKDQLWVVETGSHRVSVFNSNGEFIHSIGVRGSAEGQFNFPTHICLDSTGRAYIVDAMNFRVQVFDDTGNFINSFGEAGDATGSMARPKGIAIDKSGHIYLADALFHSVQIFDREGRFLYYFGNQGRGEGQFWLPSGIFIDENDYIYVTDSFNNRIQVFRLIHRE